MSRWIKIGLWMATVISLPLAFGGLRAFLSRDPFGYFNDKWADPFGGNIGSVMKEMRGQADAARVRELILEKLA